MILFIRDIKAAVVIILAACLATPAAAFVEDFSGVPAGTVIAGEMPGGGTAPGTVFADFTLSVTNTGGGPHSLVIFDSGNPTGGDFDLGTPNQAFGGPGIGNGGGPGQPGENAVALGNLLICVEDIVDSDGDGLVDDPDDEAGGCVVRFEFDYVVDLISITFVDIDNESVVFETSEFGAIIGGGEGVDLGNNSVQILDLTAFWSVDSLEVVFSSSGAIADIEFAPAAVPNTDSTFGQVKRLFH